MSNIRKKLLALICMYMACSQLKAQVVPGRTMQPMPTVQSRQPNGYTQRVMRPQHDYSWYMQDIQKRFQNMPTLNNKRVALAAVNRPMQTRATFQSVQQELTQRFPMLLQKQTNRTLSVQRQVLPGKMPFSYYQQMIREKMERLHMPPPPVKPVMP